MTIDQTLPGSIIQDEQRRLLKRLSSQMPIQIIFKVNGGSRDLTPLQVPFFENLEEQLVEFREDLNPGKVSVADSPLLQYSQAR
ncbi:hypothetical protein MFRU_015g01850 [Monilinia fructicola]|nr:hypothetical protein MFRU_015g01850 [Monilinia fructicola]